jgi:hypothetical protein
MLDAGLEGHQAVYGFGGDEGNPFVFIQQSPYIDFTSAHPYPDETWAHLTIPQTQTLVTAWINDSHNVVGKPFFMGEFNSFTGVRSDWWTAFYSTIESQGADGDAFWWYADTNPDAKFGVTHSSPELSVFRAHSAAMKAKSGPFPTPTVTPTTNPTSILRLQYMTGTTGTTANQMAPAVRIVNTGAGLQSVPMSELKIRYWYTTDTAVAESYGCLYSGNDTPGCANITASIVTLNPARTNADHYLELGFTAAAGTIAAYASSSDIQSRINKSDWSNYTQSNDYSFDGTKTAFADWTKITMYRNGVLIWGVEPGGGGSVQPTNTPTRTLTPTLTSVVNTPTPTVPVATFTRTPTATTGPSLTPTRTSTATTVVNTPTRTATPTTGPSLTPSRTSTATTPPVITSTPTPVTGACAPVTSTITIPFTFDGAGTFCWQASSLGSFINSWNTVSVSLNGVNVSNIWVGVGSYPAKINGFYYVGYNSTVAFGHFEAKP